LGTVAASTGYMVAMASPTDPEGGHRMNWARVLTHELVHVVTLQQTRFNCPHWYTEGLAVWCEGIRRPDAWNKLLRERVANGKLFNLDTLNFGFSRPQSGGDWQLAYCQAELYVEYMLSIGRRIATNKGEEVLRRMLAAYTDGLSTPDAIHRVFGMSQAEFERGYLAFLKQEMAKGLKSPVEQLRKAAKEHPADVAAAVALANADHEDLAIRKKLVQMALDAKDHAAAERWAGEGIEIDVMDAVLHRVVAESAARRHDYTKAVEEYESAVELKPDDLPSRFALADALVQSKQPAKARGVLEQLLKREPGYPGATALLKSIKDAPEK
jgi:cellulose synthase operon protein C